MREFLLTFGYVGKIKKAPGTFGSLAALIFWFFLSKFFFHENVTLNNQNIFWAIFLILAFIYGCLESVNYAKKFGQIDHQAIVLDEVVGQILALQMMYNFMPSDYFYLHGAMALHLIFCFAAFRFFDITKPLFIGYCDRNFKNGFGVMFDDLVSGLVAGLLGIVLIIALSNWHC